MAETLDALALSEKLLTGEIEPGPGRLSPFMPGAIPLTEVGDRTAFLNVLSNVCAFATDDGLVLVDTGTPFTRATVHGQIRSWSAAPLHAAVYSHGHIDHVFGVLPFEEEAAGRGWPAPRVLAHEAMPARFDRYVLTAGWNTLVNRRQFGIDDLEWPTEYRYPDETYHDRLDLDVGGEHFELHHARGETDDHTWTWVPGRKTVCTGDLVIWCTPNAGNPQKVQRYAREWVLALREMAGLGAEVMLPGHGLPVVGAGRIRAVLTDTADLLESLHDQTVELMNRGATLNEVVHEVQAPTHLLEKPYLRPIYDEPEFVVRNVWRLYGGWHDGNPAHLKPARDADLAAELATLAGGAERLADRARELAGEGRLRLAGHLAEWAALAAPDDAEVHSTRAEVNEARVEAEPSRMAKGIFGAAARESRERSGASESR